MNKFYLQRVSYFVREKIKDWDFVSMGLFVLLVQSFSVGVWDFRVIDYERFC